MIGSFSRDNPTISGSFSPTCHAGLTTSLVCLIQYWVSKRGGLLPPRGKTGRFHALPEPECSQRVMPSRRRPAGREALAPAGGMTSRHRHADAPRAVSRMLLELVLRTFDVPEPLERIRPQGETEAWPIGRMHHTVRTDVERLVE